MALTKGEKTRALILKTSLKMIQKQAFLEISFNDIAKACKLSQSALMYYFASKDELYQGICHQIISDTHQYISALGKDEDDAQTLLENYCLGNYRWFYANPEAVHVILLLYYLASSKKDFSEIYLNVKERAQANIKRILLSGYREKLFWTTVKEAPDEAEKIHSWLIGFIVNRATTGLWKKAEDERKIKKYLSYLQKQ